MLIVGWVLFVGSRESFGGKDPNDETIVDRSKTDKIHVRTPDNTSECYWYDHRPQEDRRIRGVPQTTPTRPIQERRPKRRRRRSGEIRMFDGEKMR